LGQQYLRRLCHQGPHSLHRLVPQPVRRRDQKIGPCSLHRLVPKPDRRQDRRLGPCRVHRQIPKPYQRRSQRLSLCRERRRGEIHGSHRVLQRERTMSMLLRTAMFCATLLRDGNNGTGIPGKMPVRRRQSRAWTKIGRHVNERQNAQRVSGHRRLLN
jgi:hypothetical protein